MSIIRFAGARGRRYRPETVWRRWTRTLPVVPALALVAVLAGVGLDSAERAGFSLPALESQAAGAAQTVPRVGFPICQGGGRFTCVVDGDTFWLEGERIRIADINTPETGSPECAAEAELGVRAAARLAELLNAGPFALTADGARDTDSYGRKLRVVVRDGRSIGETLVAENLAHRWEGRRNSWC